MGLLAKASKEAHNAPDRSSIEGVAHPGNEASGGRGTETGSRELDSRLTLPPFKAGSAVELQSRLLGKSDFLGIIVEPAKGARQSEDSIPRLAAHIRQALGPSSMLYFSKGKAIAFGSPNSDWDPEIYKLQLIRSIRNRLGESAAASMTIRIGRFSRRAPDLEGEVAKFAGL